MRALGVIDTGLVTINVDDNGDEILTFPVKALREQILECMNCLPGGEFVPGREIKKALAHWNDKPLTIDHPQIKGELVFADNNENRDRFQVGSITNARWRDGFLWVDAHLNRTLASRSLEGRGIVQALLTGGVDVEVSTGYGMDLEYRSGSHDGRRYQFSQSGIEPDHLALLPIGTSGACSVEDGCGAARAAQRRAAATAEGGTAMTPKAIMDLVRGGLRAAGHSGLGDDPIENQNADDDGEAGTEPIVNADGLDGDVGDAANDPVSGDDSEPGSGGTPEPHTESEMKRDTLIAALAASDAIDFSDEELQAFADERLNSLATLAGIDCGCPDAARSNSDGEPVPAGTPEDHDAGADDEPVELTREDVLGLKQLLSGVPALIEAVNSAKLAEDTEREGLIAALASNDQCAVSKTDLTDMSTSALRGLSRSFDKVDYSGRGGVRGFASNSDDEGFMPLPAWHEEVKA
jgi:hypothetical protein